MEDIPKLPFDTIASILAFIPERKRYFCRQVSKSWLAWVDGAITQLDLSKRNVLELFTNYMDNRIIYANAEKISKAERVLLTAAQKFKNLKKIKLGADRKSVRETYIANSTKLGPIDHSDDGSAHPLLDSFAKKNASADFAPILQEVEGIVTKHKVLQESLIWSEFSLKRVRDDIDPLVIVHLVKNCPVRALFLAKNFTNQTIETHRTAFVWHNTGHRRYSRGKYE